MVLVSENIQPPNLKRTEKGLVRRQRCSWWSHMSRSAYGSIDFRMERAWLRGYEGWSTGSEDGGRGVPPTISIWKVHALLN